MRTIFLGFIFALVSFLVRAQGIESGASVYIAPMENGLEQFISAEIFKQKLPITITANEKSAQYALVGKSVDKGSNVKWYDVVWGTAGRRDTIQASFSLVRKNDKAIIWAANAGDRSAWWGLLKRGGERKVALRIVKSMKKDLFGKK